MSGIPLSPKHGLNPTIPVCFWCGKEKNEIALLGRMKGDAEAPMHAILNYEPCDSCKAIMAQGVTFAESVDGKAPTGKFFVMKKEPARRFLTEAFTGIDVEQIMTIGKVYLDPKSFEMVAPKEDIK